ncbi:VWA domain-containing protein [Salinisphaera sp.]|uniref:vWA domain-containing protein n=1 Tax=Salinisphaera sp. TaxID=1914330 RepID=UPI000C4AAEB0|nr:VWA domain-containing protein [Salinisphaera sp.]MBS61491.1 hypothetical protein [Salinisphaera sp.]
MQRALTDFVRALRAADVRVSPAETLDAFRAVELIGWRERSQLKHALAAVLAKSADEADAFDACFEQFFRFDAFGESAPEASHDKSLEQASTANEPSAAPGEGQGGGGAGGSGGNTPDAPDTAADEESSAEAGAPGRSVAGARSPLGRQLMANDRNALAMAISQAARAHGLEDIKVFTQQGLYTRRILDSMGRGPLMDEILAGEAAAGESERALAAELRRRYERLRIRVRDHVEDQFLLHADAQGERLREQLLYRARLAAISRRDDALMRRAIERMARQLTAAHSRKRRVKQRGKLDVPRTLRRNMRYDGTLIELAWRSRQVERPRVFAICDVSGSVALYARFMLMFLYSLGDVLPKVRAFAFCSDLGEVTDLFQQHDLDEAMARTLAEHGQGSSDYGHALADFERLALADVDRRSTVLILGDARNNEGEARTDLLRKIYDRARRVIWLNPEPRVAWDTGDSVMGRYRAHCHQVNECGSLAQLERVVSDLLRHVH